MITLRLEEADVLNAYRLAARHGWKRWLAVATASAVTLAAGLALILGPWTPPDLRAFGWMLGGAAAGGWIGGTVARRWLVPRRVRRRYRERQATHRASTLTWDETGMTIDNENGHMRAPWSDFVKWRADERVMLLYRSRLLFMTIPKRVFGTPGALRDFESHAAAHVPRDPVTKRARPR